MAFQRYGYNCIVRTTVTENGSTLNMAGKTVIAYVVKPSGTEIVFTESDANLVFNDETGGIVDIKSTDATLWNEVGWYKLQLKIDGLWTPEFRQEVKDNI